MADEASAGETASAPARRNFVVRLWRGFWQPVGAFEGWRDAESKLLDETAKTIRRTMLTLIAFSFFCLVVISLSDESLTKGTMTVPFANVPVAFTDFLLVGPLVLIALAVYLHIYIGYWHRIPAEHRSLAPPFIFTMNSPAPQLITAFTFYWLVPVVLWLFVYKVGPHNAYAKLLLPFLMVGAVAVLCWLQFKRTPDADRRWWPKLRSVGGLAVSVPAFLYVSVVQGPDLLVATYSSAVVVVQVPGTADLASIETAAGNGDGELPAPPTATPARPSTVQPAPPAPSRAAQVATASAAPQAAAGHGPSKGGAAQSATRTVQRALGLTRGLNLAGADLRKVNLFKRDLRGADLRNTNLSGVDLSFRDLRGADLRGADLRGADLALAKLALANLRGADIRFAIALVCILLRQAENWHLAYRDKKLACGASMPKPPPIMLR
jgi:hypothetical protein